MCGVFGAVLPAGEATDAASLAALGLFALQHRGQESAGLAVSDGEQLMLYKDLGMISSVLDERRLPALEPDDDEHEAIPLMPRKPPQRARRPVEFVPPAVPDANRRYSRRVQLDVDIGLHSETNFFVGFAEDISDGGLFVGTYDRRPVGKELTLWLVLPGGKQVVVSGRVTWIRDPHDGDLAPGVGVRFERLDEDDRKAIDRFLSKRAPMFFES